MEGWKNSFVCGILGMTSAISLVGELLSLLILFLVRTLGIVYPMKGYLQRRIGSLLALIWIPNVCIVGIVIALSKYVYNYGLNRYCYPFVIPSNKGWILYVVPIMFLVAAPTVIITVACFIWKMIDVAEKSAKKMATGVSQPGDNRNYSRLKAFNIFKAITGPVGCWIPLCVLSVIQMCGVAVDPVESLWINIFGALSALYNPIVHVILKYQSKDK